jgi:hypothetical protein
MKKKCALLFIFFILLDTMAYSHNEEPKITDIAANKNRVPLYEKFELTFQAQGSWDNPFDPDQVAIDCIVYAPNGDVYSIPAFYFQDYHRVQLSNGERHEPYGEPCWKVRLTPTMPGTYRYKLQMQNGNQMIETQEGSFIATPNSNKRGFVKISKENPYYFEYENGEPFLIIGENLGVDDIPTLNKQMTSLARAGCNFVRTWWCNRGISLESNVQTGQGLGKICMDAAWVADYQTDLAEKLDMTIMVCFETQQYLRANSWWDRFTYNVANGGPVQTPGEYFSNDEAKKYFKRRLRYIVARWSYSTSIFSWQFWNEVNAANNFSVDKAAEWHREMAEYLRNLDPYKHIINTNFSNLDGYELIDSQPDMEVISTNSYSNRDMAHASFWGSRFMTSRYEKPFILTEYGLGHQGGWAENDPKGVMVHNGLWGAILGGSAGSALPWGWGNWVDAQNMYHYFDAFNKTFRDVPFHRFKWKPVEVKHFEFSERKKKPYYTNVFFEGFSRNYLFEVCTDPISTIFRITPDGKVENQQCFNAMLVAGGVNADIDPGMYTGFPGAHASTSRQTLKFYMPSAGQLIIHVPEISGIQANPILSVSVNGREVLHESLRQDVPAAVWAYFKSFPINLSEGINVVTIANAQKPTESMWHNTLFVAYELTNFRRLEGPNLNWMGLQSDDHIFIWLRNPEFTWMFDRIGREPIQQPEGILTLDNVTPGDYTVVWRNTISGEEISRGAVSSKKGQLKIFTPPVSHSAIAHLVKMKRH